MDKLKDKYVKVKKLVTEGATEGERVAAKEAILRMEQKHPELLRRKAVPEDVYRGFQANIVYDEAANLSNEELDKLNNFFRGRTWTGIDLGTSNSSVNKTSFQMWRQNLDGTWRRIG